MLNVNEGRRRAFSDFGLYASPTQASPPPSISSSEPSENNGKTTAVLAAQALQVFLNINSKSKKIKKLKEESISQTKSAPSTPHTEQRVLVKDGDRKGLKLDTRRHTRTKPPVISVSSHHLANAKNKSSNLSKNHRNDLKSMSHSTLSMSPENSPGLSVPAVPLFPRSTKKFHKQFSEVDRNETVLNYYVCAYVADILHQGTLFITENYFAFYSNIFGFVNRILIPISKVGAIKKKKTASFIPNAVGIQTIDGKVYVFSSLISRDNTYRFMDHIWRKRQEILDSDSDPSPGMTSAPNDLLLPQDDSPHSDSDLDDPICDSPQTVAQSTPKSDITDLLPLETQAALPHPSIKKTLSNITVVEKKKGQPTKPQQQFKPHNNFFHKLGESFSGLFALLNPENFHKANVLVWASMFVVLCLLFSAIYMMYRVEMLSRQIDLEDPPSYETLYEEVLHMQQKLHSAAAEEISQTINSQLEKIAMVRQSLDALSYSFNQNSPDQSIQD